MAFVSSLLVCFAQINAHLVSKFCLIISYGQGSIHLALFSANLYLLSIYFCLSVTYGSFSFNLVQNSTIFICLVAPFVVLQLGLGELQYELQYIVMNTSTTNEHFILVFLLLFQQPQQPTLAHVSDATCSAKPHSQRDVEPSWTGLNIALVIHGWLHTWAVVSKLRPYKLLSKNDH